MTENNFHNNPYVNYAKDHLNHSVEYGKKLMSSAQDAQQEITKKMTNFYAHNLAHGKSFLDCKSVNEVVDWCHDFVNSNVNQTIDGASSIYSKTCNELSKANGDAIKNFSESFTNIKNKFK